MECKIISRARVIQEINNMQLDISGLSETFWKGVGDFTTSIPMVAENYRIQGRLHNIIIIQVYAPTTDSDDTEAKDFYGEITASVRANAKSRGKIIISGDFNAKVGRDKVGNVVGPCGLGNQVDYILVSTRYRNTIRNAKTRQNSDCGSDHNPVVIITNTRLKKIQRKPRVKRWDIEKLQRMKEQFKSECENKVSQFGQTETSDELWREVKATIEEAAENTCGKTVPHKKKQWMTADILQKMETRRQLKADGAQIEYKQLKREIQRECREAKEHHFEKQCKELEYLDNINSNKLHKKLKDMKEKMPNTVSSVEVESVINNLSNNKSPGDDNIPAEFLKQHGTTEYYDKAVTKATQCSDFGTTSLISHASKILLKIILVRISPLIERQLDESQLGFRSGRGTRDAIFMLRILAERTIEKQKNLYLSYIDYTKAFDRINHAKLLEVMEKANIPAWEKPDQQSVLEPVGHCENICRSLEQTEDS
ncbi:uncharacterized protein LOC125039328 [Penaeus chinensis]|uniref:uncharacterized protein LOC125039328 n=1 Tax=Penaeus chinensis TaxID=139456 RepID=UPI001FB86146|nr:uncharacterized protein LOC125039328 [Penaeus chinensis]